MIHISELDNATQMRLDKYVTTLEENVGIKVILARHCYFERNNSHYIELVVESDSGLELGLTTINLASDEQKDILYGKRIGLFSTYEVTEAINETSKSLGF